MTGRAPLTRAVYPSIAHNTAIEGASLDVPWVSVLDAKARMALPLATSTRDADIRLLLNQAVAEVEKLLARRFSTTTREAEWAGRYTEEPRVLGLRDADASLTAVSRVDESGTATLVPTSDYNIYYDATTATPLLRLLTDVLGFTTHEGVWATATYSVEMSQHGMDAQVARSLVLDLVEYEYYGGEGRDDPRQTPSWRDRARNLQDMSGVATIFAA